MRGSKVMLQFDMTVGIPSLITIVVLAGSGIGAWYVMRAKGQENTKAIEKLEEDMGKQLTTLAAAVALANLKVEKATEKAEEVRGRTAHELAEYKLAAAERFATNASIRQVEERIVQSIDRLGDRLDKWLDNSAQKSEKR